MGLRGPTLFKILLPCIFLLLIFPLAAAEGEHFRLGNIYLEAQEFERALAEFKQAEAAELPTNQLYNNIGYAYYLKNDLPTAEQYYQKALKLPPPLAITYNNLGVVYQQRKVYAKAVEYYQQALALEPTYAKAAYNLAVTYYRMGYYWKAASQYLQAKKINAAYGEMRFQKERVINSIKEELRLHPDNKDLKRILYQLENSAK